MMEETFWPIPPGPEGHSRAELYREYKRLVNNISEKLHKGEVLALAYQHDLPAWFVEIGPMHEPGYALRVLSQMEGRQVFSPTNLRELSQSLETIGRVDLVNMVKNFEDQHREVMESGANNSYVTSGTPEPYLREESIRSTSLGNRRYLQDTFTREEKCSQSSSLDQQMTGRPFSENRSRHGSMDKCSTDHSREGTPFESILDNIDPPLPQDVNLGIEMAKMSTETLGNQLQLVQQMLANRCLSSPSVHHSLTNAYLLTKQISSLLNIASDSIKMVPMGRYQSTGSNCYMGENDPQHSSPIHSRHNSLGEIHKRGSQGSLNGCGQVFNGWESSIPDVQRDGGLAMYRTHSQPQVFYHLSSNSSLDTREPAATTTTITRMNNSVTSFNQYERMNGGDTKANVHQLSPLEFTDVAFGEGIVGHSLDNPSLADVPPPLPPRPAYLASQSISCVEPRLRVNERCYRQFENTEELLSPIKKHGYQLMRPSRSVQELNRLTDSSTKDSGEQQSKSLTRTREGSYSGRGFKFFGRKKTPTNV